MNTNADCTLFNAYIDQAEKIKKYQRTYLKSVFWNNVKAVNVIKSGLENANSVEIFIPFTVNTESKKYVNPKHWNRILNNQKSNFWTLQCADIIVKGIIDYEIIGGNTLSVLQQNFDDVIIITSVDTKDFGSYFMRHWEVGGA